MTYTRTIQIRLSRGQHSRIKADTVANGFDSVSNYIRYLALARDRVTERKIWEIHNKIVGSAKDEKVKVGKHYPFINT